MQHFNISTQSITIIINSKFIAIIIIIISTNGHYSYFAINKKL